MQEERQSRSRYNLPDDTLEPVLEPVTMLACRISLPMMNDHSPLDSLLLVDLVRCTNLGLCPSALRNPLAGTGHAAVEVHTVDTNTGVVLDSQVDVLADTEAEVASLGEVALPQLVFLDLEATLENFLRLGSTDGDVHGDLFVTTDTEGTDGVAGLA